MAFNDGHYGFYSERGVDGSANSAGPSNPNPFQQPGAPPMTRPTMDRYPMRGTFPNTMDDDSNH